MSTMHTKLSLFILTIAGLLSKTRLAFADSVNVSEVHTSTTKTTTYTILGMDQTMGIIVIATAVIVLFLIIMMVSRSSSTKRTTTTVVK